MEKLEHERDLVAERGRPDRRRVGDADRLPDGARDRLRARDGRRQEGRVRAPRTTYFHEADTAIGFAQLNDPACVTGVAGFKQAVDDINFAVQLGLHRLRAHRLLAVGLVPAAGAGHLARLPDPRHRRVRLAGLRPRRHTMRDYVPFAKRPHAVDQPYLVSWNNKQAPGWAAADDEYAYGPAAAPADDRRQGQARRSRAGEDDARPARAGDGGAGDPGHPRLPRCCRSLLKALGKPPIRQLRDALALLRAWHARRAHRRDLDRDGTYDDDAGGDADGRVVAEAGRAPSSAACSATKASTARRTWSRSATHTGSSPAAPDFSAGW